ncbi:MAG: hypothetical protein AAFU64_15935 [Bacteroidota bacterium]
MKKIRSNVFTLIGFVFFNLGSFSDAQACLCFNSYAEVIKQDFIFVGKVLSIRRDVLVSGDWSIEFKIYQRWKPDDTYFYSNVMTVYQEPNYCASYFEKDSTYLVSGEIYDQYIRKLNSCRSGIKGASKNIIQLLEESELEYIEFKDEKEEMTLSDIWERKKKYNDSLLLIPYQNKIQALHQHYQHRERRRFYYEILFLLLLTVALVLGYFLFRK